MCLQGHALLGFTKTDVKAGLVHVEMVLRAGRRCLHRLEDGLAVPPGQELQKHQCITVGPSADLPEHTPELHG